jgi:hypothetical protein
LPRRHILSAAGALAAALLLAVQAPVEAQEATGRPLRGSIGPQDAPETQIGPAVTGVGQGQAADRLDTPIGPAVTGVGQGQAADSLDTPIGPAVTGVGQDPAAETEVEGLGGLGDEVLVPVDGEALGGLGDEVPGEEVEVVAPAEPIGLTQPTRAVSEPRQIHSALLPEPHDLDPFVPIGIRIGSFLIFPEAELGVDMTDNVLATRTDRQPDIGPEATPKIRVNSDWARHSLNFEANGDRIWYSEFPIADVKNYQLLLRGRLDVTRRTKLSGEIEKSQVQEGPSSISLTDITSAANEVLREQHATAGLEHTFNRLTFKLTGTIADYNYSEDAADTTLDGPVPFADIRDYREVVGTLRTTYEFQSAWAGFIETSLNERDYREPITVAGFRRGSTGYTAQAGVNLRLGGTVFGEIAAGWGEQQPIDSSFEKISGPLVNGDLIWMPTASTKLEFIARTEINETTLEDSAGAIDHFFQLSLQQAFWRYLVLGTYASYEIADFTGDPEIDRRVKLGATAEYYFNPVWSVYARFENTEFTSTPDSSSNFVENEIKIGVKLRR